MRRIPSALSSTSIPRRSFESAAYLADEGYDHGSLEVGIESTGKSFHLEVDLIDDGAEGFAGTCSV